MFNRPKSYIGAFLVSLCMCALIPAFTGTQAELHRDPVAVESLLSRLGLSFEENRGQAPGEVDFLARGSGYDAYFGAGEVAVATRSGRLVRMRLKGGERDSRASGLGRVERTSNYFTGSEPERWRTGVANYAALIYRDLYCGIDLKFYGSGRRMEYDFIVAPGANPRMIEMSFDGAEGARIDASGNIDLGGGESGLTIHRPFAYQAEGGVRRQVECRFSMTGAGSVSLIVGEYDRTRELVIDPVLEFSTFAGGSGTDIGYAVAVDNSGDIYLAGTTSSVNFPLRNPLFNALNGASDAFVMKINPATATVLFSTFIGGRNPGDRCWAVSVDDAGFVYLAGETSSLNFPLVNPFQTNFRGSIDGFVAKLSHDGGALLFSSYLGGYFFDIIYGMAVDRFGSIYVTGRTEAPNFPVKNALQPAINGARDAFVTKINADGDIEFSTYLGGGPATSGARDEEAAYGIALDSNLDIYIAGYTDSPTFPTLNAAQSMLAGVEDAFVAKLSADGSRLIYSTYFGGTRVDNARGIAVDSYGGAYITGYTVSPDFPLVNPIKKENRANIDAFVARLSPSGREVVFSTYFGGSRAENTSLISENVPVGSIAVDGLGNIYITGKTESEDFPTVAPLQSRLLGDQDAFVARLDPSGTTILFSTFLGSSYSGLSGFEERGLGLALDRNRNLYVAGQVLQVDFPTIFPSQRNYGGGLSDAFVCRISTADLTQLAPVSAASYAGSALAAESIVAAFGLGMAPGVESGREIPLPTSLLGTRVIVRDSQGVERRAPLFFVSPSQVNFQMPEGTATGPARVSIVNIDNFTSSAMVYVDRMAPGLFSVNASGQGLAAAFAFRIKPDGTQSYEPVAQMDGEGRMTAVPINLGSEGEEVFLLLFGTGIRNRTSLEEVKIRIGEVDAQVSYAGPQNYFVGQDQVNVRIPRSLAGRGMVGVTMTVDERISNQLQVAIR